MNKEDSLKKPKKSLQLKKNYNKFIKASKRK